MSRRVLTNRRDKARGMYQSHYGFRMTNAWGGGDLPAPYAEGDVVNIPADSPAFTEGRIPSGWSSNPEECQPGLYRVVEVFSIDEDDWWYFRVCPIVDGETMRGNCSDRLHVIPPDTDYTAGWELVECADPDGLALRQQMLADGWIAVKPETCPTCGSRVWNEDPQ